MKLIIAIVQSEDAPILTDALMEEDFQVTRLSTMGGFLKMKNVTLMIGTQKEKLERALEIVRDLCKSRTQSISAPMPSGFPDATLASYPIEVVVGGATVFVVDCERFEKF